jgi:hypothetical protein
MNFYVYCLSDEVTPRMIENIAGVASAEVSLIQVGELTAVVSRFDGGTVAAERDNVFAHERVISHLLSETTPLPFRFGTVVGAERLETYIDAQKNSLQQTLVRVRGCVEMSVKVIWDKESVKFEIGDESGGASESVNEQSEKQGPGAAFLLEKRREIIGDERLKERAEKLGAWLSARLDETARESSVEVQPLQTLVVKAAHLVERERLAEYRERLQEMRRERNDLRFLTSGPWPPYSFS